MKISNYNYKRRLFVSAISILLALLAIFSGRYDIAHAAGVVSSCTEAELTSALTDGGLVTFDCDGTITISDVKTISVDTTIDASGHNIILDGGLSGVRLFSVNAGISLTLRNLTLQNASTTTGSAIIMNQGGDLTIEDCRILNNVATGLGGAIYADVTPGGDLANITIERSLFENNQAGIAGGAIYIDGGQSGITVGALLEISDSRFYNNQADITNPNANGGAIFVNYHTTLNAERTLFDGNQAGNAAGALFSYNSPDPPNYFNLANNTFSENSAGYAIDTSTRVSGGAASLTNSNLVHNTFVGNYFAGGNPAQNRGSAVYWPTGTVLARDNIFSDNTGGVSECVKSGTNYTGNLTSDGTCNYPTGGSAVTNLDTSLQNNGGPTYTYALLSGSNAIDTANTCTYASTGTNNLFSDASPITQDQRGAGRAFNTNCDKGAYEQRETLSWGTCGGTDLSGSHPFEFSSGKTVTINVNIANGLNCVDVEEMGASHVLGNPGIQITDNWWHIRGNIDTGFDVNLTLPASFTPNVGDLVCRYTGSDWDCAASSLDQISITRNNVTEFSDWATFEDQSPTAISLSAFRARASDSILGKIFTLGLIFVLGMSILEITKRS